MAERLDVELLLERAAAAIDTSGADRVLAAVGSRVVELPAGTRRPSWFGARSVLLAAAAILAVLAVLVTIPGTRAAMARLLGVQGVEIVRVDALPADAAAVGLPDLELGDPTTIAAAARGLGYAPLTMAGSGLGPPDAVYLDGSALSYVYRTRPGLPESEVGNVGLLLTQFDGRTGVSVVKKVLEHGTPFEEVSVAGKPGVWVEGAPHAVAYLGPDDVMVEVPVRLAGNVLVWQDGDRTVRLEANLSRADALALAEAISE